MEELILQTRHTWLQELGQVDLEANRPWLLLTFKAKELFRFQPMNEAVTQRVGNQSADRGGGIWKLTEVELWFRSNEQTPDPPILPSLSGKDHPQRNPGSLDKQEDC